MSDLTTGRFSDALTGVEQPLSPVEMDRPVADRETPRETSAAELQGRRAGDPCGSCGSTETTDEPGDGAYCLSCGASDIESEAWVDLRV